MKQINKFFVQQQEDGAASASAWKETDLDVMDARLQAVTSLADVPGRQPQEQVQVQCPPAPEPGPGGRVSPSSSKEVGPLRNGWHLLTETDGWRPCPIGIYTGGR